MFRILLLYICKAQSLLKAASSAALRRAWLAEDFPLFIFHVIPACITHLSPFWHVCNRLNPRVWLWLCICHVSTNLNPSFAMLQITCGGPTRQAVHPTRTGMRPAACPATLTSLSLRGCGPPLRHQPDAPAPPRPFVRPMTAASSTSIAIFRVPPLPPTPCMEALGASCLLA